MNYLCLGTSSGVDSLLIIKLHKYFPFEAGKLKGGFCAGGLIKFIVNLPMFSLI